MAFFGNGIDTGAGQTAPYPQIGPGQSASSSSGGTSYSDPGAAQQLISQILSGITESRGQLQQGIQNPAANPNYQTQLAAHQASQRPQNLQQMQDLGDVFRGVGNMSSGIYGGSQAKLLGQQGLNEGTFEANLGNSVINQLIQSLLPQILQGPALMDAMKLQQQSSVSNAQAYPPASRGGGERSSGSGGGQPKPSGSDPMTALLAALSASAPQRQSGIGQGSFNNAGVTGMTGGGGQYYNPFEGQTASLAGTGYENGGAGGVDQYGYTTQDWANDPYYNN